MPRQWIAQRMSQIDSSGIRRVFDLAAQLTDPVNLSIGQPDFPVPEPIKQAAIQAIQQDRNGYSVTQGIAPLLEQLQQQVAQEYPEHADRQVFVTSGTSGALLLALMVLVDPGDEVVMADPYFVMYPALVSLAGGKAVPVDTYPDFRLTRQRLEAAITPRTKVILFNSPCNPTGHVADLEEVQAVAQVAREHGVALISDEIYRQFCYDRPFVSPARFYEHTLVVDGYSKAYAVTGWRLGFAHGPSCIIQEMLKLQQYSFVCAPHPLQWGILAARQVDMSPQVAAYRRKRDLIYQGLHDLYPMPKPQGAFYAFAQLPPGVTGQQFVEAAVEEQLLVIPGGIFSARDTHIRISYAAPDETIRRGVEVLRRLHKKLCGGSSGSPPSAGEDGSAPQ